MDRISTLAGRTVRRISCFLLVVLGLCLVLVGRPAQAQIDQGTITGTVTDVTGAVIRDATVTLNSIDTGLELKCKSSEKGTYVFSPIKIGNYAISVSAPGFETTTHTNIHIDIRQHLNLPLSLKPGAVTESVTVTSAPPLLQTETSSVGQVVSAASIDQTPLNGRNWVYIAQLTAGVAPGASAGGARGGGTGDFSANGQRTTQNNFILDGVDNNVNVDDFQNGTSYNVKPPPDALAEFKIDTSDYDAEFGHSAGAVVNASLKAGSNAIHGDMWEYVRNTKFDAADWTSAGGVVPAYHENQFGATLGLPIIKNKLFYFGDAEANRIAFAYPDPGLTVPTASMRKGDFSELFNTSLTGLSTPVGVFSPNTGGTVPLSGTGAYANPAVANPALCTTQPQLCSWNPSTPGSGVGSPTSNMLTGADPSLGGQVDTVAKALMNLYPAPNAGGWTSSNYNTPGSGTAYSNFSVNDPVHDDTWQWDQRLDWNPSVRDQGYARYSYTHNQVTFGTPLGPILDGAEVAPGGFHGSSNSNLAENFMASETHIFRPTLINEIRFGYNWGSFAFIQANKDTPASTLIPGMNGVPFTGYAGANGGLPMIIMSGTIKMATVGARHDVPSIERQNVYQVLDNLTTSHKNHFLKFGVQVESIRTAFSQSVYPRGRYSYSGTYTGKYTAGASAIAQTGMGAADAFTDNMANVGLSPGWTTSYYRNYRAAYAQDDWKVNSKLTVNIGARYDFIQPDSSKPGAVANLVIDSSQVVAAGSGVNGQSAQGIAHYVLPSQTGSAAPLSNNFIQTMASNHVDIQYSAANPHSLVSVQHYNFSPRVGVVYQINPKTVARTGFGLFYGSIEAPGGAELETNYPFSYTVVLYNNYLGTGGGCYPSTQGGAFNTSSTCPSTGTAESAATVAALGGVNGLPYPATIETGMGSYLTNGGIGAYAGSSGIAMSDSHIKTTYTESYNLTLERELTHNMILTVGYLGNVGKHTFAGTNPLGSLAVTSNSDPSKNQKTKAFPSLSLSTGSAEQWIGDSRYNGLQAKLQQRLSNGLSFLAAYTWAHSEDDASNPGIGGGPSYRNTNLIPLKYEMTSSNFDIRQRFTFSGAYELPFGKGKKYANAQGMLDYLVGRWSTSATWVAQTGMPFTVATGGGNYVKAVGFNQYNAIRVGDPFKGGGTVPTGNLDSSTCPAKVKTKANWYNPCAFVDPTPGTNIPVGTFLRDLSSALQYSGGKSNQIHGPGWERVNMSLFKSVPLIREQYVQLRVDAFNLFNTPTWGNPGTTNLSPTAGKITNTMSLENYTPDSRFFQLAAKWVF